MLATRLNYKQETMKFKIKYILSLGLILLLIAGCRKNSQNSNSQSDTEFLLLLGALNQNRETTFRQALAQGNVTAVTLPTQDSKEMIALGKALFFDRCSASIHWPWRIWNSRGSKTWHRSSYWSQRPPNSEFRVERTR